jgi:hypothetical protein
LLLGIEEGSGPEKGIPVRLVGIQNVNLDDELNRLGNIILNGVEPRIFGLEISTIQIAKLRVCQLK